MTNRQHTKLMLVLALAACSAGGLLLHAGLHPMTASRTSLVPALSGFVSLCIVTALFYTPRGAAWAYLLNGMTVIVGTITMVHYSLADLPSPPTPKALLLQSTFPSIVLLWTKYFIGTAIFDLERSAAAPDARHAGRFFRFPNHGFWLVHLLAMSAVYAAGHLFWRR